MADILRAPRYRVDNEISKLTESVASLLNYCVVTDAIIKDYGRASLHYNMILFGASAASLAVGTWFAINHESVMRYIGLVDANVASSTTSEASPTLGSDVWKMFSSSLFRVSVGLSSALGGGLSWLWYNQRRKLDQRVEYLVSRQGLQDTFVKAIERSPLRDNRNIASISWPRVLCHLLTHFEAEDLREAKITKFEDFETLVKIATVDIPQLRRMAAPTFPVLSQRPFEVVNSPTSDEAKTN